MSQTQCALAPAVFQFQSNEVRTTVIDGDPWFVAQDVLNALEYAEKYTPKRAINHVPEEWKGLHPMKTPGGKQAVLCISEQGLYFFLGRSDKPKALPFQKWLAGEVLPAIRKTGRYEAAPSHQNTPVETGESIILKLHSIQARNLPDEQKRKIVKQVQEMWPTLLPGDAPPVSLLSRRWLVYFDGERREVVREIPPDAAVMTPAEFMRRFNDPDFTVSDKELWDFAEATFCRLRDRMEAA
ncbi:MAG: hypothetical protein LBR95_03965 [Azoarcus sp.]|jgi:prophage antirepressor-like protein|nr:hypothetical protein [Azoarcus sp.]